MSIFTTLNKYKFFIKRHLGDIKTEGFSALFRKSLFLIKIITSTLLLFPTIIVIRLLSPWIIVRFFKLHSTRIGHFAGNTEIYLSDRDLDPDSKKYLDFFYIVKPLCNEQLLRMFKRVLKISFIFEYFDIANKFLPYADRHKVKFPSDRDLNCVLEKTPIHIHFTPQEQRLGKIELEKIGIDPDGQIVCFINRDSAYLNNIFPSPPYPQNFWNYHDYRNMNISNFSLMAENLANIGYYVIRMGQFTEKRLEVKHPKIIDYANGFRTDFLDIFLASKCRFFINGMAGFDSVPLILFRKKVVQVNFVPIEYMRGCSDNSIFIFKKIWDTQNHRLLKFSEVIKLGIGRFLKAEEYSRYGLELIENTKEEINDAVMEMEMRIQGKWEDSEEDNLNQEIFKGLFIKKDLNKEIKSRVGSKFFKDNIDLFT